MWFVKLWVHLIMSDHYRPQSNVMNIHEAYSQNCPLRRNLILTKEWIYWVFQYTGYNGIPLRTKHVNIHSYFSRHKFQVETTVLFKWTIHRSLTDGSSIFHVWMRLCSSWHFGGFHRLDFSSPYVTFYIVKDDVYFGIL